MLFISIRIMHVHATQKIQHKLISLKSKIGHLSRFCNSKVTDNVSKVYLTQNVWLNAHDR